jgi:hypothetical protein
LGQGGPLVVVVVVVVVGGGCVVVVGGGGVGFVVGGGVVVVGIVWDVVRVTVRAVVVRAVVALRRVVVLLCWCRQPPGFRASRQVRANW